MSDKTDLEKWRIKILVLSTVKENSIRKGDTIVLENLELQFYFYAIHWSCSIANVQNTAHAVLDINKFVYT